MLVIAYLIALLVGAPTAAITTPVVEPDHAVVAWDTALAGEGWVSASIEDGHLVLDYQPEE